MIRQIFKLVTKSLNDRKKQDLNVWQFFTIFFKLGTKISDQ